MSLPTDSFLSQQWHLGNTGGLLDLNLRTVWNPAAGRAYTGNGVRVVVIDSGFDYGHPDLAPNYDTTLDRDFVDSDSDAAPGGNHGTSAMGIIGAAANNGGVVGVAFNAKLIGFRNDPSDDDARLTTTRDALRAAVSSPVLGDVINISQGLSNDVNTDFGANRTFGLYAQLDAAIDTVVVFGRGGLGTTIVKSAGNARANNYDVNADGMANDTRQVVVAAVDQNGFVSDYSTYGAALLVSAFGSNRDVVTTDRRGAAGYNTAASPSGDYNLGFDGTSAAAPMVTGIVAMMLEANSNLGWRDVQTILAYSARHVGSAIGATAPSGDERFLWQFNGATNWNGDGLHFSNDYGYGLVDAHAAVRLAETWAHGPQTSQNQSSVTLDVLNATSVLPDGNTTGITYQGSNTTVFEVERATVALQMSSVGRLADLQLYLISPSGTVSQLIKNDDAQYGFNNTWTFETQAFRGETSVGQWSVRAVDSLTGFSTTLTDIKIQIFGRGNANDDMYIYTDEYAEMVALRQGHGWEWQDDGDGGFDSVNFAALSSSTSINYDTGETTIDGLREFGGFGSSDPNLYVIERFTFGDGNDFLMANFANNEIRGMRGNDEIHGRDGSDTIFGGDGNDLLYGDNQPDRLEGEDGNDVLDTGAGSDSATGAVGNDMLFGESLSTAGLTFGSGLYTRVLNQNNTSFANAADVSSLWSLALDVNILGSNAVPHVKIRALTDDTTPATQFYKINVKAGEVLLLDVDVTGEDLALRVFDAAGNVVAQSDDSNMAIGSGGSTFNTNPYIAYVAETSGFYTIEIGNRVSGSPLNNDLVFGALARAASFEMNVSLVSTVASDDVDTLIGSAGNDVLVGGGGDDVMWGGSDADILIGGAGNDIFVFDTGDVANGEDIQGGAGTDEFYIRSTTSFVSASTFLAFPTSIETLTLVNSAQATFFANHFGAGRIASDVLLKDDGVGANTLMVQMDASNSFDASKFRFDASWDAGDVVQITGDSSSETIIGSSRTDRIQGGGGADTLFGGAGTDVLEGGLGDDIYFVDNIGDVVTENANEGNDIIHASIDYTIGANIESLVLDGLTINGAGNATGNAIVGNDADNIIDGRGGGDLMQGGKGNDIYVIDNAADSIVENLNEGNDIVQAHIGYTIGANIESLVLMGATVNGDGNGTGNAIVGNDSDNIIDGKGGADLMQGGKGNDIYFVDNAGDAVTENLNEGNDIVHATIDYTIAANVESLILDGTASLAGAGNSGGNAIVGNSGSNILDGRGGQDFLIGNAGNDTFAFKSGEAGGDLVADFAGNGTAAGDSFLFLGFGTVAQGAAFTQVGATNQWKIHSGLDGHNEIITLQNSATVDPSDFFFV